jgi:solute carrier family 1 (high affinity glutamate transporter) protein 2
MFPENVVQACSQQIGTSYKRVTKSLLNETLTKLNNGTKSYDQVEVMVREIKYIDGTNVMGLVVFCTIIGIFISHSKSEAQILYDFFFVMNELIMKIVALIMWYTLLILTSLPFLSYSLY